MNIPAVYKAISDVTAELAKEGIAKDRKNAQQGYNFRGIDDVYNAIAPILADKGLVIIPRYLTRTCEERQSAKGGALFYVTVEAEFDFVAASDGSKHTARTFGEAMDSADKATNKAMSAAYKYAAFQTFAIPTEGDNDADAKTPDPLPKSAPKPPPEQKNTDSTPPTEARVKEVLAQLEKCTKSADLRPLWDRLTKGEQTATKEAFALRKNELVAAAKEADGQ